MRTDWLQHTGMLRERASESLCFYFEMLCGVDQGECLFPGFSFLDSQKMDVEWSKLVRGGNIKKE